MSAGSFAMPMPTANQLRGPSVGRGATSNLLEYPQSPATAAAGRRSTPIPQAEEAGAVNPGFAINAENAARTNLTATQAATGANIYNQLSPEQRNAFLPRDNPTGAASLRIVGRNGVPMEDNTPNPEGIARGQFNQQYATALAAGQGDAFAAKLAPGGAPVQAQYNAAATAATNATATRARGGRVPLADNTTTDPKLLTAQAAMVRAQAAQTAAARPPGAKGPGFMDSLAKGVGSIANNVGKVGTAFVGALGKLGAANVAGQSRENIANANNTALQPGREATAALATARADALKNPIPKPAGEAEYQAAIAKIIAGTQNPKDLPGRLQAFHEQWGMMPGKAGGAGAATTQQPPAAPQGTPSAPSHTHTATGPKGEKIGYNPATKSWEQIQ